MAARKRAAQGAPVGWSAGSWDPVGSVRPYDQNPRENQQGVAPLARILATVGQRKPIVVDPDRVILAGHTTLLAAESLGWERVWVHEAHGLTPAQARAWRLGDNRVAEFSQWDPELLVGELEALAAGDLEAADISDATAIPAADLDDLLAPSASEEGGAEVTPSAYGGATAMARASAPIRYWREAKMIRGEVLDFGCGHERHEADGWARYDAFHAPDPAPLWRRYDRVLCSYVLNVQPADHLAIQIAVLLRHLCKPRGGLALVAIRSDLQASARSSRGTQVAKTEAEWRALLGGAFAGVELATSAGFFGYVCRP